MYVYLYMQPILLSYWIRWQTVAVRGPKFLLLSRRFASSGLKQIIAAKVTQSVLGFFLQGLHCLNLCVRMLQVQLVHNFLALGWVLSCRPWLLPTYALMIGRG